MTRLRHLSIRDKLLLMLAAALTPALGIILYTGWEQRAEAVADAHKEAVLLADSMAVQQALLPWPTCPRCATWIPGNARRSSRECSTACPF